jgi:cytochrome P450
MTEQKLTEDSVLVDDRPVVDFDHNATEHSADPVASYRNLRSIGPIVWTEAWGGYWVLAGYDAIFDAARDDALFSSARMDEYGGEGQAILIPKRPIVEHFPIDLDPPASLPYRRIMNQLLTPSRVEEMRPMVERYTALFIDDLIEKGEADFATLTGIPSIITIDWLGLPLEDWRRYSFAHRKILSAPLGSPEYIKATEVEIPALTDNVREVIAERRKNPGDDPISFILGHEINGQPISEEEVLNMVDLIISGGVGTVASLSGQALEWLSANPDVRQRLIDNPDLMMNAVEEFLRYFSPAQALARTVGKDADFHGVKIKKGDRALLAWASGSRDAAGGFENPDEVDIERMPNRHLAFGVGSHRCAGSHLGRLMARTILTQVLERMPDYRIDPERVVRYPRQGVNTGFDTLPATFTPGKRLLDERL